MDCHETAAETPSPTATGTIIAADNDNGRNEATSMPSFRLQPRRQHQCYPNRLCATNETGFCGIDARHDCNYINDGGDDENQKKCMLGSYAFQDHQGYCSLTTNDCTSYTPQDGVTSVPLVPLSVYPLLATTAHGSMPFLPFIDGEIVENRDDGYELIGLPEAKVIQVYEEISGLWLEAKELTILSSIV